MREGCFLCQVKKDVFVCLKNSLNTEVLSAIVESPKQRCQVTFTKDNSSLLKRLSDYQQSKSSNSALLCEKCREYEGSRVKHVAMGDCFIPLLECSCYFPSCVATGRAHVF